MASTSRGNCHFLGTCEDDVSLLESGLYKNKGYNDDHTDDNNFHLVYDDRSEGAAGTSFDPRLLMLLKYFRELYVRQGELFKKIFPGIQDEFAEVSRKIGAMLSQVTMKQRQVKTIRRSLSLGSHRTRGIGRVGPPVRPERFKVRTVVVDNGVGQGQGGSGGQGAQGDPKSGTS